MHHVADRNHALVRFEPDPLADAVGKQRPAHQPDPRASPDDADSGGSALEHDLAKNAEQNLRRAAAGGPSDTDQSDRPK